MNMLKQSLIANAGFSAISGLLMLFQATWLETQIPLPTIYWTILGFSLVSFAASLLIISSNRKWQLQFAKFIVGGDMLWVVAVSILMFTFSSQITTLGTILIIIVNAFVASFAVLQYLGLSQYLKQNPD